MKVTARSTGIAPGIAIGLMLGLAVVSASCSGTRYKDATDEETINGKKYFVYADTYYRPFASDGETIYMVVEDPAKA